MSSRRNVMDFAVLKDDGFKPSGLARHWVSSWPVDDSSWSVWFVARLGLATTKNLLYRFWSLALERNVLYILKGNKLRFQLDVEIVQDYFFCEGWRSVKSGSSGSGWKRFFVAVVTYVRWRSGFVKYYIVDRVVVRLFLLNSGVCVWGVFSFLK